MAAVSALPVVVPLLPVSEEVEQPAQGNSSTRLTLSQLLNPALWDLPEWNGPQ